MRSCFRKCSAVLGLIGWVCTFASFVHAQDDANIDLAEIARRVTAWRASFVNVRVVWEVRGLPETNETVVEWPPPPDAGSGSLFGRQEWIWADHGLDLLEDRFFFYDDGSSRRHSIETFNGPKGVVFRAQFRKPKDGPEELEDLLLQGLGAGKPISAFTRTPMWGLYWPNSAQWLPELLSEWKWNLAAIEDVGGEPCARIEAVQPGDLGVDFTEILWLDLNHDCLVRRQSSPAIAGRRTSRDFIVDEFQRLEGAIWFPKRGRLQLGGTQSNDNQIFVVADAAVNQSIDLTRFEPPTPAVGTVVDDHGRSYRYGVPAPAVQQSANVNAAGTKSGEMPGGASAAPPTPGWLWWSAGLVSVSVVFLVAGFWFSHQKREDPS